MSRPHTFFQDVVLKSEAAQKWLQVRLTVADKFPTRVKNLVKPSPSIWLLTGVYLMTNASHQLVMSSSSTHKGAIQVPVPEPSGVAAALGVSSVGGSVSSESKKSLGSSATIEGERVWAARWQKVRVKRVVVTEWEETLGNQIRLLEVFSTGVVRGPKELPENKMVSVELAATEDEEEIELSSGSLQQDDWAEFDEEVDLLICQEEEEEDEDDD